MGIIIFLAVVLGTYFCMNWYVLGRFASLLAFRKGPAFYLLVIFMTFSLWLAVWGRTALPQAIAQAIFNIGTMWFGICFLMIWVMLALQAAGLFIRMEPRGVAIAAALIGASVTIYANFNARNVHINHIKIDAPVNLTAVQLSDIHIGSTGIGFLRNIIKEVNKINPDVIFITGDLFDNHSRSSFESAKMLDDLKSPVFFSSGNHEDYVGHGNVHDMLKPTRVRWLENESTEFKGIEIMGVNNNFSPANVITALKYILPRPGYRILMYHQPRGVDAVATMGINLMLSGHTHGGQIWPFRYFVRTVYSYISGLYRVGNCTLHISSGTGTWGPRMRLGTQSEITVLELRNGK